MPIVARNNTSTKYPPAPAGAHAAICVDVIDMGMLEVTFGGKTKSQHKIRIAWQIGEDREDGKPFLLQKRYTLSLHEKASLRKDLEAWRGKTFSDTELDGFDVENLLGAPCLLGVIHAVKDGDTFANVQTIMRLPKGMEAPKQRDYIRVCDRKPEDLNQAPSSEGYEPSDEDVPF